MLGFDVSVTWAASTDAGDDAHDEAANSRSGPPHALASWRVRPGGLKYLAGLVAKGAAKRLQGNGYPTVYATSAQVILPVLTEAGVAEIEAPNRVDELKLDLHEISACPADAHVTVTAWDLS